MFSTSDQAPTCRADQKSRSAVVSNKTLVGGLQAGKFTFVGVVRYSFFLIRSTLPQMDTFDVPLGPALYIFSNYLDDLFFENRALWLARSFALSCYNHRAVIITLKASSFQNGSKIFWCFGVGNLSILLFSRIIINVIIRKQLVASGDVNIGELFADIHVAFGD